MNHYLFITFPLRLHKLL